MRLILFFLIVYLFYYCFKRIIDAMFGGSGGRRPYSQTRQRRGGGAQRIDELVKDPSCGVYIPKKDANTVRIGGKRYFFCSRECKEKFLKKRNNGLNA